VALESRRHMDGRMYRLWPMVAWLCLAAACGGGGGGGSSCESPPDLTGPWSGVLNDSRAGGGTLMVTFDQTDCTLGGGWQTVFANPSSNGSGNLIGSADGTAVSFSLLTQAQGACGYQASGTLKGGNEIAATFATVGNNCASDGTLDIVRLVTPTPIPTATMSASPTPTPAP